VPIEVKLTEYKRKKVDAGLGFSTNTGSRVQLNLENLSRAGWQTKLGATVETRAQNANLDFTAPVSKEGYHDSYGTSYTHATVAGEETALAKVAFHRRWGGPNLTRDFQIELLSERKTLIGQASTRTHSLPLTYEVTWRHLDSLLQPKRGYLLQAKIGGAPLPVFGGQSFVRAYTRGQYYFPLGKQGVLLARAEIGALASRDTENIPSTYLFRAGGDQSVRGYGYQQLGVREGDAITGARYMATSSVEYQHWLSSSWGAAVFVDGGNAANQLHGLHPAYGYGVGGRWNSPVGPINVDVAYGRAVRKVRLHFSLGVAF
jgi:translocation and assembly module TamA